MLRNNPILLSGAVISKRAKNGKVCWLIIKQNKDQGWEIAKVAVKKGESSVRAAVRLMGEKGVMDAKVLEEAGRYGGTVVVNGKRIAKRVLYYVMIQMSSGEIAGFEDFSWAEPATAIRKLELKIEKDMLRNARKELKIWTRENKEAN